MHTEVESEQNAFQQPPAAISDISSLGFPALPAKVAEEAGASEIGATEGPGSCPKRLLIHGSHSLYSTP